MLGRPITTIVIPVGHLGIDNDELLPASLRLFDLRQYRRSIANVGAFSCRAA
jgi:hypothetical protein